MSLRDSWIYAGRTERSAIDKPQWIVTNGMSDNDAEDATVFFAQAVREDDGSYSISYARRQGQQGYGYAPGPRDLSLCGALEVLDEWQRRHCGFYSYTDLDIGMKDDAMTNVRHYTAVAREMGVALGPEAVSLRHAEAAKRTVIRNPRKKSP